MLAGNQLHYFIGDSFAIVVVVRKFSSACPFTLTILIDILSLQCFDFEISNGLEDIRHSNN